MNSNHAIFGTRTYTTMKLTNLFILLFSLNSLFAQEYVNLFQKDLTDRIKFESFSKQTVEKELETAANIHPELLYYYIFYYNMKYDGKVEPEYKISEEALGETRGRYVRARNDWFCKGEISLRVIEKDTALLAGEIQYFYKNNPYKDLEIRKVCDSCYKSDKNHRDYIVYKLFIKNENLVYQPNIDYAAFRNEYEIKSKNRLEDDLKKLNDSRLSMLSAKDDYQQMISLWYLFPESDKKGSIPALYTKLVFTDYNKNYKFNENKDVVLAPETFSDVFGKVWKKSDHGIILNYNNILIRSFNYQNTNSTAEPKINNSFNIPANQVFAGISISVHLPAGSLLTKIILEAGFGTSLGEKTLILNYPDELPPYSGSGTEEIWISDKMVPEKNNIIVKNINEFSFKVKTPLLFVGDNLSLGIGGTAELFALTYITNMDFYFRKIWRGLNYSGQVVTYPETYFRVTADAEKASKVLFKMYPLLAAEYKLPLNFNLNLEVSLNYYVIGFCYNL